VIHWSCRWGREREKRVMHRRQVSYTGHIEKLALEQPIALVVQKKVKTKKREKASQSPV